MDAGQRWAHNCRRGHAGPLDYWKAPVVGNGAVARGTDLGAVGEDLLVARNPLPRDTELHGRYRIGTVLGAGGFAITYIGQDVHLNRPVAIKWAAGKGRVSVDGPVVARRRLRNVDCAATRRLCADSP